VTPDELRKEAASAEFLASVVSYRPDKLWLTAKAAELRRLAERMEQRSWDPPDRDECVPGRHPDGGDDRGVDELHVRGNRVHVGCRNNHVLGVAAGDVAAQHLRARAPPVHAARAVGALPASDGRVDHDAVPLGAAVHPRSARLDHAGDVHAGDVRQRVARDERGAAPLQDVEMVQPARRDTHEHLARAGLRGRDVGELEPVHLAVRPIEHCLHRRNLVSAW